MDRIELLGPSLLDNKELLKQVRRIERILTLRLGWHYYLDLIWTRLQLPQDVKGLTILDAGAGQGLMQWWLAAEGATVISVDKAPRHSTPPRRFRIWCTINGLHLGHLQPSNELYNIRSWLPRPGYFKLYPRKLRKMGLFTPKHEGKVHILQCDIGTREFIKLVNVYSVDHIVSISALEHNEVSVMRRCVDNLLPVLKPGGRLIATVCAAKDADGYNTEYDTQLLTEESIVDLFQFGETWYCNMDQYDKLFKSLMSCKLLRDRTNHWNPSYMPVGVVKVKE